MNRIVLTVCILFFIALIYIAAYSLLPTKPKKTIIDQVNNIFKTNKSQIKNEAYYVIIDYNLPILKKRLWVISKNSGEIIINSHVSHAWKSGFFTASKFSNNIGTHKSCKGIFITQNTYFGKFGYSMYIKGIENGVNNNALKRSIIFHNSYYLWSDGCFTTLPWINANLINLIKNGTLIYVHKS